MAEALIENLSDESLVIALTGNRHNRIIQGNSWDPSSKNLGAILLERNVNLVSINLIHKGGDAWVCIDDCGIHKFKGSQTDEFFNASKESGYQYHWNIGHISASLPKVN